MQAEVRVASPNPP